VPSSWVRRCRCLVVVVSATSLRHPWPSCSLFPPREQLLATALVLVLPSSSWLSHSWGCWVVARRSVISLATLLPVSTLRAVARSGGWPSPSCHDPPREQWRAAAVGRCFSSSFSLCSPFPPCEQGLAAVVWVWA
jgi:hypothetical protein